MISDPIQQRQLQNQVEQSPIQRRRPNEERFVSETAGGQSVRPTFNQWQQYAGGPLDAQFVPSVDTGGASLIQPGMFVGKLRNVVGNNVDRLRDFRGLNTQQQEREASLIQRDKDVEEHELLHERVAREGGVLAQTASYDEEVGATGKAYRVGGKVMINLEETGDPKTDKKRGQAVIAAALAPLSASTTEAATLSEADKNVANQGEEMVAKAEKRLGSGSTGP